MASKTQHVYSCSLHLKLVDPRNDGSWNQLSFDFHSRLVALLPRSEKKKGIGMSEK